MMTPPRSISARPRFTRAVPVVRSVDHDARVYRRRPRCPPPIFSHVVLLREHRHRVRDVGELDPGLARRRADRAAGRVRGARAGFDLSGRRPVPLISLPSVKTISGPLPVSSASDCSTPAPPRYFTNITTTFFGASRTFSASMSGAPNFRRPQPRAALLVPRPRDVESGREPDADRRGGRPAGGRARLAVDEERRRRDRLAAGRVHLVDVRPQVERRVAASCRDRGTSSNRRGSRRAASPARCRCCRSRTPRRPSRRRSRRSATRCSGRSCAPSARDRPGRAPAS